MVSLDLFTTVYASRNPLIGFALRRYLARIEALVAVVAGSVERVLDAGCGEGFVTRRIHRLYPDWQIIPLDLDTHRISLVKGLTRDIDAVRGSVFTLPFQERAFDLVMGNEILEHLPHPERALHEFRRVCVGHLLTSVPDEPFLSLANLMRGAHIRRLGRTPSHVSFWSAGRFITLLGAQSWEVMRIERCLPWVIVLARPCP